MPRRLTIDDRRLKSNRRPSSLICRPSSAYLISTSTPAGRLSLMRALIVFWVGSRISMSRLCVRISSCSCESLSMKGDLMTENFSILVGRGTGPATSAPVRSAVSTICTADWSSILWSNAFRRILIFCFAAILLSCSCASLFLRTCQTWVRANTRLALTINLCFCLLHQFPGNLLGHFLVVVKLERRGRTSLGHRAEVGSVPEEVSQRHITPNRHTTRL